MTVTHKRMIKSWRKQIETRRNLILSMLHERVVSHVEYHENDVFNSISATYNFNCNQIDDLLIINASWKIIKEHSFSSLTDLKYSSMYSVNEVFSFIRNQTSQLKKSNNTEIATEKTKNTTNQSESMNNDEHETLQEILNDEQNQDQKNDSDVSVHFSVIEMSNN